MKYDLRITGEIDKDIFHIGRFDIEWCGEHSAFDNLLKYLQNQCVISAVDSCVKTDPTSRPEYDRGYVRGIYEVYQFLSKAYKAGEMNSRGK